MKSQPRISKAAWGLILIGLDKLVKAALLLAVAVELPRLLLSPDLAHRMGRWVEHIRVDPQNRHVHAMISAITGISPSQLHHIRLGSFLYAGLDLVEGIGLVLRKRWAEYLTTLSTGLFLPIEIYEIFHGRHHAIKIGVFIINLVIVIYLVVRLQRQLRLESRV